MTATIDHADAVAASVRAGLAASRPAGPDGTGATDVPTVALTGLDEVMLHLDDERRPWTVQVEVRAPGSLDEARLRAALVRAVRTHPLAGARLGAWSFADRAYAWELPAALDVDPVRVATALNDAVMDTLRDGILSAPVPLEEAPAFRLWLIRRPGGDTLLLSMHHALTDGSGALRFLQSVVRAYAGAPDPVPDVDPLAARSVDRLAPPSLLDRAGRWYGWARSMPASLDRPTRLARSGAVDEAGYGLRHVVVPAEEFATLEPWRHGEDTTVNDLLLAALHLAVADWNADHAAPSERISVMMPVNLRPRDRWREVLGNLSLMVSISSRPDDRDDAEAIVAAVRAQTARAKRHDAAAALAEVLARNEALPAIAKRALPLLLPLTGNRAVDTVVLSNLGRLDEPFAFGAGVGGPGDDDGLATELWFSPPARMPLGVGVGAVSHMGDLFLSVRSCIAQFDRDATDAFAGYLRRALAFVG